MLRTIVNTTQAQTLWKVQCPTHGGIIELIDCRGCGEYNGEVVVSIKPITPHRIAITRVLKAVECRKGAE